MIVDQNPNRKIKTLILRDFQLHTYTEIDFTDGLCAIVGSSDNGKTAILRALSWALFNEPIESEIVQHNKKHCEVEIHFQDGGIFIRKKGKNLNRAEIKRPDDEQFTVFKNFADKYPEELINFLGNPPKSEKLGNIPYSKQSKKLFIIDESPTHLPGILADLIGVADIEEAARKTAGDSKSFDKTIKAVEKEIEDITKQIDENYIGLDDKLKLVENINKILDEVDVLENTINYYDGYLAKLDNINKQGKQAQFIKKKNQSILDAIEDKVIHIGNLQDTIDQYNSYINKHKRITSDIQKAEKNININQKIFEMLTDKIDSINDTEAILATHDDFINQNTSFENQIQNCQNELDGYVSTHKEAKQELDLFIQKLKDENLFCDECRQVGGIIV